MYCPKCGGSGSFKTVFCGTDGTRMKKEPECECGNDLWKHEKYCTVCGKLNTNKYIEEQLNVI
jgi:hypothetical protein